MGLKMKNILLIYAFIVIVFIYKCFIKKERDIFWQRSVDYDKASKHVFRLI